MPKKTLIATGSHRGCARRISALLVAVVLAPCIAQETTSPPVTRPSPAAASPAAATPRGPVLDAHARKLAQVLELTEAQERELATILAQQREQIRQVWRAAHVRPEYRASATRAIKDKTEEKIRAMLTDEQKKKYIADRPNELPYMSKDELEHWLNAAKTN
jgi:hypothetical protein